MKNLGVRHLLLFTIALSYDHKMKCDNLQYNTLGCWVAGMIVSLIERLMIQVLFFFIISCKTLCKNLFNLFSYFLYKFTKIKIKSFESPKSKPATHCYIFNLSKVYLDHQRLGGWDNQPSDPVYYIEDFWIYG